MTQDRLAERRFVEAAGIPVAPWWEVASGDDAGLRAAADALGTPLRIKAAFGGYDGRSQIRVAGTADLAGAWGLLGRPAGESTLVETEVPFTSELSVVCARSAAGEVRPFPLAANRHAGGILVESVLPADLPAGVTGEAQALAARLAEAMDLVGVLTVELFLLPGDRLVVNELAPRVHNSGHATLEASSTSQFEQHIRAICGLGLGAAETLRPAAMVNLLGDGARRPARLLGVQVALADPDVHLHLYDKREVFAGRKMGHLTALGPDPATALRSATRALAALRWAGSVEVAPDGPESPP
jgi:5-(carboxyamino)imidazole ribonucleotide synthase